MIHLSKKNLLNNIPDFANDEKALHWMNEGKQLVQQQKELSNEFIALEWKDIFAGDKLDLFGLYPLKTWRTFVLATFFADIICYPQSKDQVNFERLAYVMHTFPEGFRVWWTKLEDGSWWPVGYTGWYPMHQQQFERFEKCPQEINSRMVVPEALTQQRPFLYLFNYSVAVPWKKSSLTKLLLKTYAADIASHHPQALACITVSNEGIKVAKQFGMQPSGNSGIYINARTHY